MTEPYVRTIGMPGGEGITPPHTAEIFVIVRQSGRTTTYAAQSLDVGYIADGGDVLSDCATRLARLAWDKQEREG